MEKINKISGKVIPLALNNVDTDLIIPAQYLTNTSMLGYGENVFRRLRDDDPNFVFNQEKFLGANILVSQNNFGCGSSREHAVWALLNAGISAIIAESFSDIFFNNSAKNSLILIKQPAHIVEKIIRNSQKGNYYCDIDIKNQVINTSDDKQYPFSLEPFHQYCFLNGLDQMNYLLSHNEAIATWHKTESPYSQYGENT